MNRGLRLLVLAGVLLGLSVSAEAAQRGGKMIFARYADSLQLDPVLTDANVDIWIMTNLYDTLLQPTADGKGVVPGLASDYKVADDGLSMTLTLRQGTKFSDGSPITADDIKWNVDRARDPKEGIWSFILGSVDSVEIKDPQTIVLHLKNPDPTLASGLATFNTGILPSKLVMAQAGATDRRQGQGLRRTSRRLRPLHVRQLAARHADGAEAQPQLLADGRGRQAAALSR